MHLKNNSSKIIMIILLLFVLSSCANSENLKIGFVAPLTGEAANWGLNALAGAELAIQELQKEGINIDLIVEDSQCDPKTTINIYNKLIMIDKVNGIIGPVCSGPAEATINIINEHKIPDIHVVASMPGLAEKSPYVYKVYPTDDYQGVFSANYLITHNKKKAGIIYTLNSNGESIKNIFVQTYKDLGGTIVYEAAVQDNDFKTIITQLKMLDLDVIYLALYPDDAINYLRTAKENNLLIYTLGTDNLRGDEILTSGYANNLYYIVPKSSLSEEFKKKLLRLNYTIEYTPISTYGYDATKILVTSLINNQSINNISYGGVSKEIIEFDKNGNLKNPIYELYQYQNNTRVKLND